MNTFKTLLFGLLIFSLNSFSQGNFNNQRNNNSGINRDITNSNTPSKPSAEDIEKNRSVQIEKFILQLKQELTLDELQVIAIKNEVTSNSKNIDIVMKKEISQEDKNTEVKALMEKTEVRINSYLNKNQKEKFLLFKENSKNKKKDKKEKKDKKDKKADKPIEE